MIGLDDVAQAWHVEGTLTYQVDCIWPGIRFSPASEIAALSCASDLEIPTTSFGI